MGLPIVAMVLPGENGDMMMSSQGSSRVCVYACHEVVSRYRYRTILLLLALRSFCVGIVCARKYAYHGHGHESVSVSETLQKVVEDDKRR